MKPNLDQQAALKVYLRKILKYRETYEEIYDHILSALEYEPANINFEQTVNNIIRNDFGSHNNLLLLENANKIMVVSEMQNKYLSLLVTYFKIPALLYTLCITLLFYWFLSGTRHTIFALGWPFGLLLVAPTYLVLLRYIKIGYILADTKASAKDVIFGVIARQPTGIYLYDPIRGILAPHCFIGLYISINSYCNIFNSHNTFTGSYQIVPGRVNGFYNL